MAACDVKFCTMRFPLEGGYKCPYIKFCSKFFAKHTKEDMEKSTAKHCRICGVELTAENSTGKNPTLCTSCREKRRRDGFMTRMRRLTGKEPEFKEPEEAAPEEVFEGPKTFVDPEAPVQSPEEERPDLSGCSDLELKDELISRGWEVNCTKTQVITL